MNDLSWRPPARGLRTTCLGLALAVLPAALPAAADEGAEEYREHVMEAIGGHMQSTVDILRQKVSHQDHLSLHVNALAELSGIVHTLFPEGSQGGDAIPAIWENPEDFAAKVDALEEAATNLKSTLDAGDNVGAAFQKVGQACKSCHDDYRDE